MDVIKKIILEIEFYFFSSFRTITVGGFVNQLIKKFLPYNASSTLLLYPQENVQNLGAQKCFA